LRFKCCKDKSPGIDLITAGGRTTSFEVCKFILFGIRNQEQFEDRMLAIIQWRISCLPICYPKI